MGLKMKSIVFVTLMAFLIVLLVYFALYRSKDISGTTQPAVAISDDPHISEKVGELRSVTPLRMPPTIDIQTLPGSDDLRHQSEEALRLESLRSQVPATQWQQERVSNVSIETPSELIENIADFDDYHFAITATGRRYAVGDPQSEMNRIVHTLRVRRLLEIGRADPEQVIPLLREALVTSFQQWPDAFEEHRQRWKNNPKGFSQEEPTNYDIVRTQAIASVYLLAELGDRVSLPLILEKYVETRQWAAEHKPYPAHSVPVPPTIMLYAMHRMIQAYPAEDLKPKAHSSRQRYLEWASKHLRPPQFLTVSTWSNDIDTTDPAVRVIDPEGRLEAATEKIRFSIYPHDFVDGVRIESWDGPYVQDRGHKWIEHIRGFVDSLN